jgi:general secretion pathway protein F
LPQSMVSKIRKCCRGLTFLEPLLMVFIGVVIGVIVILMYLPVFELAGSIQ